MSAIQKLLTDHIDIWTAAETEKKSGRGRSAGNNGSVYGIKKLRELILELAVRGKLVSQDSNDEPASELLKRIQAEKARLVAEGKIKKDKSLPLIAEIEKPFELPKGWNWVRLQEVFDVRDGTHDTPKYCGSGFPLVTSKNLYSGTLDFTDIKFISEEDHLKIKERSGVDRGDILFAMIGSIGNPVIIETDVDFSIKNVALFKPYSPNLCEMHYLLKYLLIASVDMREQAAGAVQSFVSLGVIRNYIYSMPPLAEQRRIVAKVDELMALCDQLETQHCNAVEAHEKLVSHLLSTLTQSQSADDFNVNWQRIAAHFEILFTTESSIDTLKQTLLQLAVMGKPVPQDPNDEPASELLKRIQTEKAKLIADGKIKKDKPLPPIAEEEKPFNLPQGFEWTRLGSVLLKITDGTHHSPPNITKGAFKYISAKNIKHWGIDLSDVTYVTKEIHDEIFGRCNPECGDVLYIKDGATTGIATINKLEEPFSMLSSVALLKPSVGTHNEFLLKAMTSPFFYSEMRSEMTGVAITRVTLAKLNNAIIPLPPLPEQHRIVTKVDELMALCDQLKARVTEASQVQQKLADVLVEQSITE